MGYYMCPNCKNEYTVIPVLFKPGSFRCTKCEWHADNLNPWGEWFGDKYWDMQKAELQAYMDKYVFAENGLPLNTLKGIVAVRDNVLLFKGYRMVTPTIIEYADTHTMITDRKWMMVARCSGSNIWERYRPASQVTMFYAWLVNNHTDYAYIVTNPVVGLRIMESYYRVEGRFPDIMWTNVSPEIPLVKQPWKKAGLENRKILVVGAKDISSTLTRFGYKPSCLIKIFNERYFIKDNYMTLRKLEEIANDPGNYNLTIELPVVTYTRDLRSERFLFGKDDFLFSWQVRKVCRKGTKIGRIPETVQLAKKIERRGKEKNSGQHTVNNETEQQAKVQDDTRV